MVVVHRLHRSLHRLRLRLGHLRPPYLLGHLRPHLRPYLARGHHLRSWGIVLILLEEGRTVTRISDPSPRNFFSISQ